MQQCTCKYRCGNRCRAEKQYEGEAMFLRALAYFNIVRLWGAAPLILKPVTAIEAKGYGRSSVADVYRAIEEDLRLHPVCLLLLMMMTIWEEPLL